MGYFILYESKNMDIRLDPECDTPFELNKILNTYDYWDGDETNLIIELYLHINLLN